MYEESETWTTPHAVLLSEVYYGSRVCIELNGMHCRRVVLDPYTTLMFLLWHALQESCFGSLYNPHVFAVACTAGELFWILIQPSCFCCGMHCRRVVLDPYTTLMFLQCVVFDGLCKVFYQPCLAYYYVVLQRTV